MEHLSRRLLLVCVSLAGLAAVVGVALYAAAPGSGSYLLSGLLVGPAIGLVAVWLSGRLPTWLQWAVAVPLAVVGPVGYLTWGGPQWWNWGQLAVLPLLLLVVTRPTRDDEEPWLGGPMDGPWGPP